MFYIEKHDTYNNGYNGTSGGRINGTQSMGRKNAKPVVQIDTDTYEIVSHEPSMTSMAKKLGTSATHIMDICKRKPQHFTAVGFTFRYADEYSKSEVEEFMNQKFINNQKEIEVYFLSSGKVYGKYPSYYQASKELGISAGNLQTFAKGERLIAGKIKDEEIGCRFVNDVDANKLADMKRRAKLSKIDTSDQEIILFDYNTGEELGTFIGIEDLMVGYRTKLDTIKKVLYGKRPFLGRLGERTVSIRFKSHEGL
jgi:hypothetical protein